MCLSPLLIPNPTFTDNARLPLRKLELQNVLSSRGGYNKSDLWRYSPYIHVPCRRCSECLRASASSWRYRLTRESEVYRNTNNVFVTLTISDLYYNDARFNIGRYVKNLNDRLYNFFGRRIRHFYVTELGKSTKRLHLHGILLDFPKLYVPHKNDYYDFTGVNTRSGDLLRDRRLYLAFTSLFWPYGWTWIGYVNARTFNYVTKYITKSESDDLGYKPRVFVSHGLGRSDIVDDYIQKISLTSGDFVVSFGDRCRMLPKYYINRIRKHVSPAVYYRSLERTIHILGLEDSLRFNGRYFYDIRTLEKARLDFYRQEIRKYQNHYKTLIDSLKNGNFTPIQNRQCINIKL